jgi:hypothetical protein
MMHCKADLRTVTTIATCKPTGQPMGVQVHVVFSTSCIREYCASITLTLRVSQPGSTAKTPHGVPHKQSTHTANSPPHTHTVQDAPGVGSHTEIAGRDCILNTNMTMCSAVSMRLKQHGLCHDGTPPPFKVAMPATCTTSCCSACCSLATASSRSHNAARCSPFLLDI